MQTFLVTGAAGFISGHSVEWLLKQGVRVIGVDNLRTGRLENLVVAHTSPDFEWVNADAGDETAMRILFQQHRFAGVLHLAALVSVPESFHEPALNYRINLAAADSIARLCLEFDCKRLVFCLISRRVRRGCVVAQPRIGSPTTPIALRRRQVGSRGNVAGLRSQLRAGGGLFALFQCLRPASGSRITILRRPVYLYRPIPTRPTRDCPWRWRANPGFHLGSGCARANGEVLTRGALPAVATTSAQDVRFPESGTGDLPGTVSEYPAGRVCRCESWRYSAFTGRSGFVAEPLGIQRKNSIRSGLVRAGTWGR
ncbi:MAG: GDP-mannose 4,6-dehydratase [Candidatus Competibacteraceae bacterium]|nr:GDP-mannose 4,6-dehydratase [Candidatus Competibacteraceae bacterium]